MVLAFGSDEDVAAAYDALRARTPPVPPPAATTAAAGGAAASSGASSSLRALLPSDMASLRALPVKALKQAMSMLGLALTPGCEKEDLVEAIAPHLPPPEGEGEEAAAAMEAEAAMVEAD